MGFWNKYPYTDFHELNLDWIIKMIKEVTKEMNDFKVVNRIVWGGLHDPEKEYPRWCIVDTSTHEGYISIKPVPVGITLDNEDYWRQVANYSALYADFQNRIVELETWKDNFKIINVKDYGAVGDGVTDDTQAFKNAITAAQNGYSVGNAWDINVGGNAILLYIPSGEYLISDTLRIESMLYVTGDGEGTSKIVSGINNGNYILEMAGAHSSSDPANGKYNIVITNLSILGNGLNCSGVYISGAYNKLINVTINRCKNAIYMYSAYTCVIENCHFTYNAIDNGTATITCDGTDNGTGTHCLRVNNCTIQGNTVGGVPTGVGFNLKHGNGIQISDTDMESFEVAIKSTSSCIVNCNRIYFEAITTCFGGELLGTTIMACFTSGCAHFIKSDVVRGCSIIGNNLYYSIAPKMIEPASSFTYLMENYIVGNFSSGYEATLDASVLATFTSDSSNFMRTNYGHEYGTIRQYITINNVTTTIANMLSRYGTSPVGCIGFEANRDNGATDLPAGGWFRGVANKISTTEWYIQLNYIFPNQLGYMYVALYNGGAITWNKIAFS